mgnify:CR=1 FL=1|tara:strand:+ start:124 stop:432 length:309 start_codon:yes stop_codon:yes gene_type:complete
MGNLEKPLTWALIIILLGYLFVTNFGSENNSSFTIKDPKMGTSSANLLESETIEKEVILDIQLEDDSLNVDSIIEAALKDIDMKSNIDAVIKIDLQKETIEQ